MKFPAFPIRYDSGNSMQPISLPYLVEPAKATGPSPAMGGYRPELDAVRFIAFLLVFFRHLIPEINVPKDAAAAAVPEVVRLIDAIRGVCGMGLCLFFALSAYLITDLLLAERRVQGTVSVRRFYIRRVLRIWPLYFFGISIGVAWALAFHQSSDLIGFAWFLLFAGNFYCGAFGWMNNPMSPLWSISVEEQFYLIWPWAMRWLNRRGLFLCALGFIAAANAALFYLGQHHVNADPTIWASSPVQFQMFAAGILLALADRYWGQSSPVLGFLLPLSAPWMWFIACYWLHAIEGNASSGIASMGAYALIALGCAAVLRGFCILGPTRIWKWTASLGKISFGLYVYHVLALTAAEALFQRLHVRGIMVLLAAPLALLLTIGLATLSYRWLGTPFLRLKRRFETLHTRPI
jgi:peptidoglycan/LPS O-acetylase OafA/YrhL